ncbi:MAG: PRC-barrel domain-containing protein [bacterium]|nr:PRC-barrel domain-containing protein [Candidatus Kapabacteria bacterium]
MRLLDLGEIRQLSVLDSGTGDRLGSINDIVVHPTDGRLLGLIIRALDGEDSVIPLSAFRIGDNAVMAQPDPPLELLGSSELLKDGAFAAGALVGVNIVTEDGRLLGKIKDVIVLPELSIVAYKIAGSVLQKIFGGGFYIAGDLPIALSSDGVRMIVPSDTEEKHAAESVDALLKRGADGDKST